MDTAPQHDVYTVTALNQEVRQLLEQAYPLVWVEGELSNLARPRSGHLYFTLKDAEAQVRCALFRNRALRLRFSPENGQRVRLRARIGLYAPRGEYQLIAEHMEPAGDGALQQAFEVLKAKLGAEGLFDPAIKQPIPTMPRRIGVVTSPTGAAIRDVLSVLSRRFPALPVLIYPVRVQGDGAATDIAAAIDRADARREVDVVVVTRGGGSLEDLQAFNDEAVARAIHRAHLPIVSAVGHEVDISIADLAADQRAATPSAAAELLSPDGMAIRRELQARLGRLNQSLTRQLMHHRATLDRLARRLDSQHPGRQLRERAQRLDELEQRLVHAGHARLAARRQRLEGLTRRLRAASPALRLRALAAQQSALTNRLQTAMRSNLARRQARLQENARALEAVSPLATLQRGYAIVRADQTGRILRTANEVKVGDRVHARLGQGELTAQVETVNVPSKT